ncbi:hypothetical protein [Planococcus sp. SSTMD024]|uniref:phage tail protein n=1 Tax=Planococcus sp. SSTMD024 TaxID=3242163 RepID=UPI00351F250E
MEYNFQADIGADIRDFQRGMKEVDATIKGSASGADIGIGADIGEFMLGASTVQRELAMLERGETDVDIDADIAKAQIAIALLLAQLRTLSLKDFTVRIRAKWDNFRNMMGSIANFQRNFDEITGSMGRGGLMFLSPAMVPVIASTVGLLGQLGPMLGTILGSTFALATSFGAAGIGALGFAAVAMPALKGVFDKAGEINDLEMKIADAKAAGDIEKANEHLAEMDSIFKGMSGPQLEAHSALRDFQKTFRELVKDMEPGVLTAFGGALTGITSLFGLARPMIENVVDSVNNLMDSFNRNLEAQDVKEFFSFLNDFAGPALETITKAAGNFVMGFFNMMEAFGPLATETQNSFLKMSESFRQWADGLSESEKFQSFVDYVSENMPKIRSIFSDAFQGIINTFAAFAPSSADMMSSLQDMMERFKEWSEALAESQGFQNFIDYIKTNGPVVISVIGGLVDFIINLGKALAPVGEYMLGLIDRFLEWTNGMMEAHPWLGKIAGAAFVVVAGLVAIAPAVLLVNAMFGGLILGMIKVIARLTITAVLWTAKWALMAANSLFHAARIAAAWLLTTGANMVVALAKMAASAAIFIAKWALMGVQSLLHAAKVAAAWALTTGTAMVVALAKMVATSAIFVAKWLWMGAQALFAAARMAAAWFIALGPVGWITGIVIGLAILIIANWDKISAWTSKTWTAVWNWIKDAWSKIKAKTLEVVTNMLSTVSRNFTQLVSIVRTLMDAAKNFVRDKWEEAKNAAREKLVAIVSAVTEFFGKVVSKVSEKMGEAVETVAEFVGEMPGRVLDFVDDMVSAGADLVGGVISGIKSKVSEGLGVIGGLATDLISRFKRDTDTHSPSRAFADVAKWFAPGIVQGINQTSGQAFRAVTELSSGLSNAFSPQLAMADMRASAQLDTSLNRADMGVVRKSFAAEIEPVEVYQGDTIIEINGREFARATADDMKDEMDRNSYQRNATSRRRGTN